MKVKISFIAELPDDIEHTAADLEEFLRFELGDNGRMSCDNPFNGEIVEPVFGTFVWEFITGSSMTPCRQITKR